ncbi:MAG: hypothetical protein QM679_01790 [Patulibacter sp.]
MEGTPEAVHSCKQIAVSYKTDGPVFKEKQFEDPDELPWPQPAPPPLPPPVLEVPADVSAAADELKWQLVEAIVGWYQRAPQHERITRLFLLHDWPTNQPFPMALIARAGAFAPTSPNPYEVFTVDPEVEAWFDPSPREFRTRAIRAAGKVPNDWFYGKEQSPFELLVDVARDTRKAILARAQRDVWVLPLDYSNLEVGRAVAAILPPELAEPIIASLDAADAADVEAADGPPPPPTP